MTDKNLFSAAGLTEQQQQSALKEVVDLLESTRRRGVENVVEWVKTSRFAVASGSEHQHSSYRGGLLSHSLNVALWALKERGRMLAEATTFAAKEQIARDFPKSSVVIASLLHDAAKVFTYYYDGTRWVTDRDEAARGHGNRSLEIVEELGLALTTAERIAIRWHDYDLDKEKAQWAEWRPKHLRESRTPLLSLVHKADRAVRPLEDGLQRQGILLPLHYVDGPLLKDTELTVRRNLESKPREEVRSYPIATTFAYKAHKEVLGNKVVNSPKDTESVFVLRYPCQLTYEGHTFGSAEALFYYQLYSQSPDIQSRIVECTTLDEVKKLCADTMLRDEDWQDKQQEALVKAFKVKAEQCPEYRSQLLATGQAPIVQLSNYPRFLTLGLGAVPGKALGGESWEGLKHLNLLYVGCNWVGRAHMTVRESLRSFE